MGWLKKIVRSISANPLDQLLLRALKKKHKRFLIAWNRGLGDIPLGLYALVEKIHGTIPDAVITFVTRKDLAEGFSLLPHVNVIVAEDWQRGKNVSLRKKEPYDVVISRPDPTYWCKWQLNTLTPRLKWEKEWDEKHRKFLFADAPICIGVHVHTETKYGYEKNWPMEKWKKLFKILHQQYFATIVLFGQKPTHPFEEEGIVDLRGKTTLLELLSVIKNRCTHVLVPDSGILSLLYYLDESFPLRIVSLWSDPRQGILKQGVASPNPQLKHIALLGPEENISKITVEEVTESLFYDETKNP